ncbi:MAG: hypothetical protein IPL52_05180 [Flavobacteriales bacterium]|nr:hypothetical protein [Flavobacteriales bacterium]
MHRRYSIAFIVLLCLALLRYVLLAFFVHPFADDFSYAVAGINNDLLKRLADEYQFWNGRWFSNILVLRGPLVLGLVKGLVLYRLVPIALLALTWCGAYALIRAFANHYAISRGTMALGASLFLLIYLHLMPDLSEGIYWYTGAVSYQLPGALMLLLAAAWVRLWNAEKKRRVWRLVQVVVLAVIICGCNELHMVYMVLLHAALLLMPQSTWFRMRPYVALVLGFVLLAALVMVLAPGNAGRAAQFPHKHEILHTGLWGALQTGRFLLTWIASPALLITSFLYLLVCRWVVERSFILLILTRTVPWRWALFIVVMVFISMAMPYWNTGLLGQHRTVNATLLFFLPCWFFFLTLVWIRWLSEYPTITLLVVRYAPGICALLAVVVLASGSGGRVSADLLSGRLNDFDKQLRDRYTMIVAAEVMHRKNLALPALEAPPRSLRYLDATPDPGHWINRSIAQYFGADDLLISIGAPTDTAIAPPAPR